MCGSSFEIWIMKTLMTSLIVDFQVIKCDVTAAVFPLFIDDYDGIEITNIEEILREFRVFFN